MSDTDDIPIIEIGESGLEKGFRMGMNEEEASKKGKLLTQFLSGEKLNKDIRELCKKLNPETIDPNFDLGVSEIELSLAISATAGVRLIGELNSNSTASVKVKIQRRSAIQIDSKE